MSAEDLDKLFKDKLQNRPVAPGNDVWERMQARMQQNAQQETPNPFLVPAAVEEKEERGTVRMWYYSAAAAVTMLLSVGLWVNRDNIDPLQPTGTVATVQEHQQTPSERVSPAQETESDKVNANGQPEQKSVADQDNTTLYPAAAPKATERNQVLASVNTKAAPTTSKRIEAAAERTRKEGVKEETTRAFQQAQEPVMMAAAIPVKAQEAAKSNAEVGGLEIIVKLDNAQATTSLAQASTKETDTPHTEDQPGSGRVLKGILKQVKNLKDGEKVNLSEIGITKHTYALETRIGNKKITKTIEL
ncbi:hypothetical protein [Rufibacter hautae]|uniref:Uncharacterized protein n=1 Tax=Rufibacter hautae TaxID=2595005 RepID=A0A5B6TDC5_9BACT|nr:hypothetical protein [Rufibacter hautae]KAA3438166.1 hypothetical protein FOA19_12965 [Rufibacter hautae]